MISDWRNYETWEEAGSPTAAGKAQLVWPAVPRRVRAARRWTPRVRRDELDAFVDRASPRAASPPTTELTDAFVRAAKGHRR